MIMSTYIILQWTPLPAAYKRIPEWQLQAAEYALKLNKTHYYEKAIRVGNDLTYPLDVAEQIVGYWRKRWPFAKYHLVLVKKKQKRSNARG